MAHLNILQIDTKGRVTLPAEARKRSHGVFTYEVDEQGTIWLRPVVGLVTSDQAYFWTSRWQEGEKEATADIRQGRVTKVPFSDIKKFLGKI